MTKPWSLWTGFYTSIDLTVFVPPSNMGMVCLFRKNAAKICTYVHSKDRFGHPVEDITAIIWQYFLKNGEKIEKYISLAGHN